jgi:ketosteroid isomerase-like protein
MMTTQEIANKLADLCRKGEWATAQNELFAKDAVSIEQMESPGFAKETKGLDAIKKKGDAWEQMVTEVHGIKVSEPLVAENSFSVLMDMEMTMKQGGRQKMKEVCVYETKDGKIISERFFS